MGSITFEKKKSVFRNKAAERKVIFETKRLIQHFQLIEKEITRVHREYQFPFKDSLFSIMEERLFNFLNYLKEGIKFGNKYQLQREYANYVINSFREFSPSKEDIYKYELTEGEIQNYKRLAFFHFDAETSFRDWNSEDFSKRIIEKILLLRKPVNELDDYESVKQEYLLMCIDIYYFPAQNY